MASQNMDPAMVVTSAKDTATSSSKPKDTNVTKRLNKELMNLMMSSHPGVSAFPDGDNLFRWIGTIDGAKGTVYENLKYKLTFEFHSGYPYSAPVVKFETPIYHPNVDEHGNICLDILKEAWAPTLEVRTVLLSIQSLLGEPNNASPLNVQAADMWDNQEVFKATLLKHYKDNVENKKK